MLSHHAYYIEGSLAQFEAYERALREEEGFGAHDPGFSARRFERFGIDEARALIQAASLRHTGSRSLFFIAAGVLTTEAQQALLKLLEEPHEGTRFVLLVPHGGLLPTVRSRMLQLSREEFPPKRSSDPPSRPLASRARPFSSEILPDSSGVAKEFLSWPYKKRSDWVASFLKEEEDARERARQFFVELELELYPKIANRDAREGLEDIEHFRQYLSDRSPSLKMILEHLAATLPTLR